MQSVQRQFGKLMGKAPADSAKTNTLIKDYEDIEQAIAKIVEDAQLLQRSWNNFSVHQTAMVKEYRELYDPIVGTCEDDGRSINMTPESLLSRVSNLHEVYSSLHAELPEEIIALETQLLAPATEAGSMMKPFHSMIKKREDKKLDLRHVQDKVQKMMWKNDRSIKEEKALAKARNDMARLTEEFEDLDTRLCNTLTPLVQAAFSLLPPLLATLVIIQNRLLGLSYTVLHEYCLENGFPSPAPDMPIVVSEWDEKFRPVATKIDGFAIVSKHPSRHRPVGTATPVARRIPSSRLLAAPRAPVPLSSSPVESNPSPTLEVDERWSPSPGPQLKRKPSGFSVPTDFTTATVFQGQRNPSWAMSQQGMCVAQAVAAKKKPPPPPRPGPKPRSRDEFVVAEYDFTGGVGDLSFSTGDVIKVVQKTATDQDWWQGELHNVRGTFPANYCKPAA